jgi:hypothetical protein
MLKILLGVALEVCAAMLIAGLILALAIPLLSRFSQGGTVVLARPLIIGVLACAVAIALFRPGSTMNRFFRK